MLSYHMYPRFWMFDLSADVATWIDSHELLARAAGKVAYMGGIDDSSNPDEVKARFLEPAIEALLKGEAPPKPETLAHGCRIRFARERK